jgi:hypothetical protein
MQLLRRVIVCISLFSGFTACADFPTSRPFSGVEYHLIEKANPPNRLHAVRVNLGNAQVHVKTPRGGPDPDGPGPYQTTLMGPLEIADRDGLDIVVNGDFFGAKIFLNAQGKNRGFMPGDPATAHGPAETDGVTWATTRPSARPSLVVTREGHARIELVKAPPPDAFEVIAGSNLLVKDNKMVPLTGVFAKTANPRTAVGLADDGNTLVIVVDDGRWKDHSMGMTLPELAQAMIDLGCTDAVNLDGGGSTEMAIRNPATGKLVVVNHPSEGHERPVANVLGIQIAGMRRVKLPTTNKTH